MYCKQCGTKVEEGNKFCTRCGVNLESDNNQSNNINNETNQINNVQNDNTQNTVDTKDYSEAKKMCIASVVLTYCSGFIAVLMSTMVPALSKIFSSLSGICPIAGLFLLITVRVKYPEYKPGKIIMWVYIITVGISLVAFILFAIFCYVTCSNWHL